MKLREEIEPKIAEAETIFPRVLKLIHAYDDAVDEEDEAKCEEVCQQMSELTGKEITEDDLFEHWEEDDDELIAFGLSLADPCTLTVPLSKEELLEIIRRIQDPKHEDLSWVDKKAPFPATQMWPTLCDYYTALLELNLNLPEDCAVSDFFDSQKVKGAYREPTPEEVLQKILSAAK